MSESLEQDYSKPFVSNLALRKTDSPADRGKVGVSGSFDTEFDLLESTLSELKDGEHESKNSKKNRSVEDHAKLKKSANNKNNTSDPNLSCKVLKAISSDKSVPVAEFCSQCQDTVINCPYCAQKNLLSTTQHSKSVEHQSGVIKNNYGNVFTYLNINSSETKFEIPNSCPDEAVDKPVFFVQCDEANSRDKRDCDRPPSLSSLECLEIINKDPKRLSLSFRREELSQEPEHSAKGCDIATYTDISSSNPITKIKESESLLKSTNNCESLLAIAETMADVKLSKDLPNHPDGPNNDLPIGTGSSSNYSDSEHSKILLPGHPDGLNNDLPIMTESKSNDSNRENSEILLPSVPEGPNNDLTIVTESKSNRSRTHNSETLISGQPDLSNSDLPTVKESKSNYSNTEDSEILQLINQVKKENENQGNITEINDKESFKSEIPGVTTSKIQSKTRGHLEREHSSHKLNNESNMKSETLFSITNVSTNTQENLINQANHSPSLSSAGDSNTVNYEIPQLVDKMVKEEHDNQENTTESNKNEFEKCIVPGMATPSQVNCEIKMEIESQASNEYIDNESDKKAGIFFSTPNVVRKSQEDHTNQPSGGDTPDFGLVSPLDMKCSKGRQIRKRKFVGLQPIEEVDEDNVTIAEKKVRMTEEIDVDVNAVAPMEAGTSSTLPCFETPARSLLKKWQPSCLSRNISGSSFIILDECGETETEDCSKFSQEYDDFEIACQSLTDELMKGSSNIETLEKYHSQVQLENQMDDEKFDEILKELTMHVDVDDKTCLSVRSMDESSINESDISFHNQALVESIDALLSGVEDKNKEYHAGQQVESNISVVEKNKGSNVSIEETETLETKPTPEELKNSNDNKTSGIIVPNVSDSDSDDRPSIKDEIIIDEEDFLLDENTDTKEKPYEFFEFVSTDPKENEDNYNPEWQKLGRLTSDEERYKAVRDRWRSLVPPDPNRNLTLRQWRVRNNKSPIRLSHLNNNHQLMDDNEKNQLCTAVFDNKIKKMVQDLEDSRMNIYRQRNRDFELLGHAQDEEQARANLRCWNNMQLNLLHNRHLNQCRAVKIQYDQELKRIQDLTEDKIRILKEAREEVLLFQKFYKGVGARDDNDLYMTDIQVQELMETEEMLEKYKVFYKG